MTMIADRRLMLAAAIAGMVVTSQVWALGEKPLFEPAVRAHLEAVAGRDMEALLPTLTTGEALIMIAPDGKTFNTRQEFVDFHRAWFASNDGGHLEFEIVRTIDSAELGHALVRYSYMSRGPDGAIRTSTNWLALTFALEDGHWRLVFDQNTPIASPAE